MDGLTYQQLLAQQYEENAHPMSQQEEFTNDEYNVKEHVTKGSGFELEDPHRFQQFAGNRNLEEDVVKSQAFEDKSKLSVRYNKDVRTSVFNIDTRFRAYSTAVTIPQTYLSQSFTPTSGIVSAATQTAAHFIFRFSRQIKNAISIKLSSLELPNTFANFSANRLNSCFGVRAHTTSISAPLYTKVDIAPLVNGIDTPKYYPTPTLIASAIQTALKACGITNAGSFTCVVTNGYVVINNSSGTKYDFDFMSNMSIPSLFTSVDSNIPTSPLLFDTLGTTLGFSQEEQTNGTYTNTSTVTGTYLPDMNTDEYIYIAINDYTNITPQSVNNTYFPVFAKIPMTVAKDATLYDNDVSNPSRKTYYFLQPSNINTLDIQLLDRTGVVLSNVRDYSMTLEIEEVVSQALYEKLREL